MDHTDNRHSCTERTDAQTTDESADGILLPHIGRGNLNNDAYDEDDTLCAHGMAPTKEVGGPIPCHE